MKYYYLLPVLLLFISCDEKKVTSDEKPKEVMSQTIVVPEFQTILDSANVEGAILIYSLEEDTYYSNNFEWTKKGHLPASTFKITNSIIALETKLVEDANTLFKWNGEQRRFKAWEQDLTLKEAFHSSCVPCYQEIAQKIGVKEMNKYIDILDYGKMDIDSSNIDMFWLVGESKISQFQQIDFLKRFYKSKLSIEKRTEVIMKKMMLIDDNENYKLSGKTGWSITNSINNGWFVGYVEIRNKVYFFASNIEPKPQFEMSLFTTTRKKINYQALEAMKIIKPAFK